MLMLGLPLGALVLAVLVGAGIAVTAGSQLPSDAQAALAPLVGIAVAAAASPLVPLGAPIRVVTVATFAVGALLMLAARRRVWRMLRSGAPALLIAVAAIVLAAAPSLASGNWTAKSYRGNTDSYLWVSQARSFLDGPPPEPSSAFPDRVAYERASEQHWAVALPVANAQLAWVSRQDPVAVYGALAALVSALFPLSVFVVARCCLGWTRKVSAAAALAIAANASLLFASYFSWQQQLEGSALAFGAVGLLRRGLERGKPRAELLLAALLAAAAVAVYRMAFAPYLAASVVMVFCGYAVTLRDRKSLRFALSSLLRFAGAFLLLASASLVAFALGIGRFVENNVNTGFKKSFPEGSLPEALGLVPRIWGVSPIWMLCGTAAAGALLFAAYDQLRRRRPRRTDFLVSGGVLLVAGYALALAVGGVPPYASYKLLGYGAAFLILTLVAPVALLPDRRARLAFATAVMVLTFASASVAVARGIDGSRSAHDFAGLTAAANELPSGAVVSIDVRDPWDQSWAIYALRDHRLSIPQPEYILTEVGLTRDTAYYRLAHPTHVLSHSPVPPLLWRRGPLALGSRT